MRFVKELANYIEKITLTLWDFLFMNLTVNLSLHLALQEYVTFKPQKLNTQQVKSLVVNLWKFLWIAGIPVILGEFVHETSSI